MKTIKIYNIKWNLKNSFYDEIPSEFMVEVDGIYDNGIFTCDGPDGDETYTIEKYANQWISYNGSKWGATAKTFDFNLVD
jgi:hypothetical protein